jgi:hypothetical protein
MPKANKTKTTKSSSQTATKSSKSKKSASMSSGMVTNFSQTVGLPLGQSTKFTSSGCTVPIHRTEMLCSLDGTTAFDPRAFQLSVGISSSFPWLSNIARCFEYFEMRNLKLHFRSSSPATWAGKWTMGIDYDAGDAIPVSITEMGTWEGTVQDNIYNSGTLTANPRHLRLYKNRMVEASSGTVLNDPRLNSCGTLYVSCITYEAKPAVGDLYIEYDLILSSPQMGGPIAGYINYSQPTSVTASSKPAPILADVVTLASNLANLLQVSMNGDSLEISAKKPFFGNVQVGVPVCSSGNVYPPGLGGTWTKTYDAASKVYYSTLQNITTASTAMKGVIDLILDFKEVGDKIGFTAGTGSNGAWAANSRASITATELPNWFNPLSPGTGGSGNWFPVA